jgi:uncharacterized coiled-coil protein SlyX
MPENDLTKPSANGPEDTRPLFERAIKEMILTREMLIERADRLESRVAAFEQTVNERFDGLESRVAAFEQTVNQRFDRLETQVRLLDHKFEEMVIDIANLRGAQRGLDKRVTELERKPA